MPRIVKLLSFETGISEQSVRRIMASAPLRYKEYEIAKRNGGMRQIAQPAREVKLLQRALISAFLNSLPVHHSATAYRSGTSIRDNALPHAGQGPILKMDFSNFFTSIRSQDWVSYCQKTGCISDDEDIQLTTSLLFKRQVGYRLLRLAIGAPSSPMLSNILMHDFDVKISEIVAKDKVLYTRYADDLTFSAPRVGHLNGVVKAVAATIRAMKYPKLDINPSKTTLITSKYHRSITGLTLTNDGCVTIGRNNKRLVHAAVYNASLSKLSSDELQVLSGTLAFINSVEPNFVETLARKYGEEVIKMIQRHVIHGHQVSDP